MIRVYSRDSGPNPTGTAIVGQPMIRLEQAPITSSPNKNKFNIEREHMAPVSDIKLIRTDTTL